MKCEQRKYTQVTMNILNVSENTEIERMRVQDEKVIKHDWTNFDTVDKAMDFFNDRCSEFVEYNA